MIDLRSMSNGSQTLYSINPVGIDTVDLTCFTTAHVRQQTPIHFQKWVNSALVTAVGNHFLMHINFFFLKENFCRFPTHLMHDYAQIKQQTRFSTTQMIHGGPHF